MLSNKITFIYPYQAFIKKTFIFLDQDQSTYLTITEFENLKLENETKKEFVFRFNNLDTNKDSKLSLKEVNNRQDFFGLTKKKMRDSIFKNMASPMFNSFNQDNDKYLSLNEFNAISSNNLEFVKDIFYVLDKNKDNKLSFNEFEDSLYTLTQYFWNNIG